MSATGFQPQTDSEWKSRIIRIALPVIIRNLLEDGLLDKDRLHDYEYITKVMDDNPHVVAEMGVIIHLHHEFIDAAKELYATHRLEAAVVLLATAIEQNLNTFYRFVLEEKGLLTDEEITEIIRNNNVGPKIGWLLTLVSEYEISEELQHRIVSLMELRNQIIHYKAVPSNRLGDEQGGSYHAIQQRIANLNFADLFAISEDLSEVLDEALEYVREKTSPEYKLAKETAELHLQKS